MKFRRRTTLCIVIAALVLAPLTWVGLQRFSGQPEADADHTAPVETTSTGTVYMPADIAKIFPRHEIIDAGKNHSNTSSEHAVVLRTDFKYPLIRAVIEDPGANGKYSRSIAMVADHLIVRPAPGISYQDFETHVRGMGFNVLRPLAGQSGYLIGFPLGGNPASALPEAEARLLDAEGFVALAEPDFIVTSSALPAGEAVLASGQLWALHNTGRDNGIVGTDIDAAAAWDIIHDAPGVIIAVIDSGTSLTHQDLINNLWSNPAEIPGNGIDDDNNGVIDDIHGFNAYAGNGAPEDDNGHGTHCAGIIAADGHNAFGYTGVAWSTRVMSVKFLSADGAGATSDAIEAIDYAVTNGAHILNLSWGGAGRSASLLQALERARDSGVIAIAAAGNDARNNDNSPVYPASYDLDNIVAVASSDRRDTLSWFSNYGPSTVRIAAPGEDILSTWIGGSAASKTLSGSSMAAAEVSGAMTLIAAHYSSDTYLQLINRLLGGAETVSGLPVARHGRLNLYNALTTASAGPVNDNFARAESTALNGVIWHGLNTGASAESSEPAHVTGGATHSVWYLWTAPTSGQAALKFTPAFSARASVYSGDTIDRLTLITSTAGGAQTFAAAPGVSYHIAVDGTAGATGTFILELSIPPANDNKADASLVTGDGWERTGTNLGATLEPNETTHANVPGGHSVWWSWIAPLDGPVRIDTDGSDYDTSLAVYDVSGSGPVIQGDAPDVVLVIDISGSTDTIARTSYIGDTNGDGRVNTILDAEIAAALAMHQTLLASGKPTRIAVVAFDDTATLLDMDPVTPGVQVFANANADADLNGTADIIQVLRTLRKDGTTNYTAALTKASDAFVALGTTPGEGNVIFLSDGKPSDSGDFGAIAESLRANGHFLQAFGAGSGSSLAALRIISPDALIFTDISELLAVFNGAVAANDDHDGRLTSQVNFTAKAGHPYFIAVDGYKGSTGSIHLTAQYSRDIQIVAQPRTQDVERFAPATFSIAVRGVAPFSYQWFKNDQLIPDANAPTFTIPSVDIDDDADYHVAVNNTFTSITSYTASLNVIIHEPVITQNLNNQSVIAGSQAVFRTRVVGTGPFTYQWYKDGEILVGATDAELVIPSASSSDAGNYHVTITNASATTTSQTAFLSLADNPFETWVRRSPAFAPHGVVDVVFLNNRFIAHGYNGLIAVSIDGLNWTDARVPGTYFGENDSRNITIKTVTFLNGSFFALGQSASGPITTYTIHRSADGINWEEIPNPHQLSTLDYLDGVYLSSGVDEEGFYTCYASSDLETWTVSAQFGRDQVQLLISGGTWKYLPNATSFPSGWTSTAFNDSAWASGSAPLGFGNPDAVTTVPSGGTTTLFRITLPSTITFAQVKVHGHLRADDGALVYFNDGIMHRQNMTNTWPGVFERATTDISGDAEDTYTDFTGIYGSSLNSSNVFAVQVHQSFDHPEDMIFDLSAYVETNLTTVGPVAGNGLLVAMRSDGKSFTSTDGINWTRHDNNGLDNAATGQFVVPTRMRFINGRFLAWTTTGKRLYSSTDGVAWTLQTGNLQPDNFDWDGQTYYYIGSTLRTSTNAASWNSRILSSIYGIDLKPDRGVYGNGIYVLVHGDGKSATVNQLSEITGGLMSYSHSQGRRLRILNESLVSLADNSAVDSRSWSSNNGADWTPVITASADLSYGHDTFLRFSLDKPLLGYDLSSPSLTNYGWTLSTDPRTPGFSPNSHIFAADLFVAVGPDGAIASSTDATVWSTARAADVADPDLTKIDYLNGHFIAIGRAGLVLTSTDAISWTKTLLPTSANLTGSAHDGTRYVIGSDNATETEFFVSNDAITWTRIGPGDYGAVRDITYGDGQFAAVTGRRIVFSADATTWASADLPNDEGWAIAYYKGTFVVVGNKSSILQSGSIATTSPAPVISGLEAGTVLTTNDPITVRVSSDASGSAITSVDFILDGQVVSRLTSGPFVWSGAASQPGEHRLSVVSRDADGNASYQNIVFTVDFSPWQTVSPALPTYFISTFTAPDGQLYGLGGETLSVGKNALIARSQDGLDWKLTHTLANEYDMVRMVASDNGTLVASGSSNFVLTSGDGENWQQVTIPCTGVMTAWGNGLFVAMPGSNPSTACVSLDGLKWDLINFGSKIFGDNVSDLIFQNGQFRLVTRTGRIFQSADGTTWTLTTSTPLWTGNRTPKFVSDGSTLCLIASDIFKHIESGNWQLLPRPDDVVFSKLVRGNGQFIGTGPLGLYASSDLLSWTQTYIASSESDPLIQSNLTWFNGRWLAYWKNSSSPLFATSTDTATWERRLYVDKSVSQRSTQRGLAALATDGEQLLAVGSYGLLQRSTDGRIWIQQPYIGSETLTSMIYAENKWVAAGVGGTIYTSTDGATWTRRTSGTTKDLRHILHNGDRFVIYGNQVILTSDDAESWTAITSVDSANVLSIFGGIVTQGRFALISTGNLLYVSEDGITWHGVSLSLQPMVHHYRIVDTPEGVLIAGGYSSFYSSNYIYSSDDLINWSTEYRNMPEVYQAEAAMGVTRLSTQDDGHGDFKFSLDDGSSWFSVNNIRGYADVAAFKGSYYAVSGDQRIDSFSLVDLQIEAPVTTIETSPGPGSSLRTEWDVTNRGYMDNLDSQPIRLEVRIGTTIGGFDASDISLIDETFTGPLGIAEALHFSRDFVLPADIPVGDYYLKIRVDGLAHLSELNENNNTLITPSPVFSIKAWTLSLTSTPGGVVRSGPESGIGTLSVVRGSASGFVTLGARTLLANRSNIDLVAIPDKGFGFAGWLEYPSQGFESLSLEMNQDRTVTPLFSPIRTFTPTVVGQGTVTVTPDDGLFMDGDPVTVYVTPADGWQFAGWTGGLSGTNLVTAFTIDSDANATATFRPIGITRSTWRTDHFGTDADNITISADTADPDHDGRPNILEYVLGSDPLTTENDSPWQVGTRGNLLVLNFTLNQQATDATVSVETTATLDSPRSWTSNGITVEVISENAVTKTIEARVPISSRAQFMRIRVQ